MEKKAEFLFKLNKIYDSILQLKNGKIIFYYFRERYNISIYDDKTFQKLFKFDIYETNNNDKNENNKLYNRGFNKNKNSIKELYNGLILIGRDNYLFELTLHKKTYDYRIVNTFKDTILDINELSDKRILVITNKNIITIKKEKDEYIIKEEYKLKPNWKISPINPSRFSLKLFNLYFDSDELPNNRLLLKSFSTELVSTRHIMCCGRPKEVSNSKIIFIDLNNFKEIKSTEIFNEDCNYILYDKYIIIQTNDIILIIEKDSLLLKRDIIIEFSISFPTFYQFDNKYIISYLESYDKYYINISKIDNDNFKNICEIGLRNFKNISSRDPYRFEQNYRFLFTLRDKRIIIFVYDGIYVLRLPFDDLN